MRLWAGMTDEHSSVPRDEDGDDGLFYSANTKLISLGELDRRKGFTPCAATGAFQISQYSFPVVGVGVILATSTGQLVTVPL